MKKIIYLIVAVAIIFSSCEDFLNTEPLTSKTDANFPKTADDAKQMMAGIYTTLNNEQTNCDASSLFVFEVASDDKIGGGGKNDIKAQSYESFMYSDDDMLRHTWEVSYEGIHRANFAIENLDLLPENVVSTSLKNQYKGEAMFLRALIYYRLATLFGDVPLKVTSAQADLGNASANDIFAQIATDLKTAIELLPEVAYSSTEQGRATRWAAQAMMARVYLFYTGFYTQTSLPLVGGGSVSKDDVTTLLGNCITASGHSLVGDYHELWPYTNSLSIGDYGYIQDYMTATGKDLVYASDNGARNPETVFAVQFNNFAQWDARRGYANMYQLFFGLRGMQNINNTVPFSGGWGQGNSIPKGLVDQWKLDEPTDIRLGASIIHIPTELPNYRYGVWDFVLESDWWGKKYIGATAIGADGQRKHDYSVVMYGNQNQDQLSHGDDLVLIRFADVLLMMSELTEDAQYMNRVRARVGLDPVGYSLENIQKERRYELAFEGLRWNDMRRWGAAYAKAALETQIGSPVYNVAVPGVFRNLNPDKSYSVRYDETKGFFPIPLSQIKLAKGLLKQVPGYTEADFYPGFSQ